MKLTIDNPQTLIEAGMVTRLGIQWPGQRCFAKTCQGTLCQNPVVTNRNRCRMHGGKSTGPRTPEGKVRSIAAHTKHGRRITYELKRDAFIP